ncbi:MAG: DnaJ domain-containing protein [Thermosynechococcus sp.]|uniref:DnaJ domain-containing protein n=1 Tax=Thermosynechococcus sp. TaxID=2814275 RepID=UPI00391A05FC
MTEHRLIESYRRLGLSIGASLEEIKTAYRQLARQYHPDINPEVHQDQFVAVHEAYRYLLEHWQDTDNGDVAKDTSTPAVSVTVKRNHGSPLTPEQEQLKRQARKQWQLFLAEERFPRAIALLENLERQLPADEEVFAWQAETYYQWAVKLIDQRKSSSARTYLKKALRLDPHNQRLWREINRQFARLEQRSL